MKEPGQNIRSLRSASDGGRQGERRRDDWPHHRHHCCGWRLPSSLRGGCWAPCRCGGGARARGGFSAQLLPNWWSIFKVHPCSQLERYAIGVGLLCSGGAGASIDVLLVSLCAAKTQEPLPSSSCVGGPLSAHRSAACGSAASVERCTGHGERALTRRHNQQAQVQRAALQAMRLELNPNVCVELSLLAVPQTSTCAPPHTPAPHFHPRELRKP